MTGTTFPLIPATFLRRYKRFLADVQLPDGSVETVHCPNTGAMTNCLLADSPCWLSLSPNPNRKYRYTWEIASVPGGHRAGVNTARANRLLQAALSTGAVAALQGYRQIAREVRYGEEGSRIDFLLDDHPERPGQRCFVEVKSVTYGEADGRGLFPDAVSTRGSKHLRELAAMAQAGERAVLFFCVQHSGIEWVEPADEVDPAYGRALREAVAGGVELMAWRARLSAEEICLEREIAVRY